MTNYNFHFVFSDDGFNGYNCSTYWYILVHIGKNNSNKSHSGHLNMLTNTTPSQAEAAECSVYSTIKSQFIKDTCCVILSGHAHEQ
jgi:hypothetical protein